MYSYISHHLTLSFSSSTEYFMRLLRILWWYEVPCLLNSFWRSKIDWCCHLQIIFRIHYLVRFNGESLLNPYTHLYSLMSYFVLLRLKVWCLFLGSWKPKRSLFTVLLHERLLLSYAIYKDYAGYSSLNLLVLIGFWMLSPMQRMLSYRYLEFELYLVQWKLPLFLEKSTFFALQNQIFSDRRVSNQSETL